MKKQKGHIYKGFYHTSHIVLIKAMNEQEALQKLDAGECKEIDNQVIDGGIIEEMQEGAKNAKKYK